MPHRISVSTYITQQNAEYRQQRLQAIKAAKEKRLPGCRHRRKKQEKYHHYRTTGNTGNACLPTKSNEFNMALNYSYDKAEESVIDFKRSP